MKTFKTFLSEDLDLEADIFSGFDFTQTSKSEKSQVVFKVTSGDRESDRDEILRRLKNADIGAEVKASSKSSVDPIFGTHDGRKFVVTVKPKSGGMGESTLNSSITELFPCMMFEKNIDASGTSEKDIDELMQKLIAIDQHLTCVGTKDVSAAETTLQKADTSSKYIDKMKAAIAIHQYLKDAHSDKPIANVYWGYRTKLKGVPNGHPGDMFIEYKEWNPATWCFSKICGKKTKEPQLNTYHYSMFVNTRGGPDFGDAKGKEDLGIVYDKVYSKIPNFPAYGNHDGGRTGRHKDKTKTGDFFNQCTVDQGSKFFI